MIVRFQPSALRQTHWYELISRILFGGIATVLTGLIAKSSGPVVAGLFLAFPAIFPATATLVEKHENRKKLRAGIQKTRRGRQAAALDARGAALGSAGLVCFGVLVWKVLPLWIAGLTLVLGLAMWLVVSVLIWRFQK